MKNVVGYLRVSTDAQVDRYGLDAQRSDIMRYCIEHDMYICKWFVEEGVSGVKEERPAFEKILYGEEVENPPYEAVVVAKNDRVARDIMVYYYFKMVLKKKDVELISVSESFGEFGAMASMLEAFTLCVAEMERENIKRRTSSGREVKAKVGGYAGGRPAYGYYAVGGTLLVNADEAEVVKKIFALKNGGCKLREIAEGLNAHGWRKRNGKMFDVSAVQSILKNESFYRGHYTYGDVCAEGQYERIL